MSENKQYEVSERRKKLAKLMADGKGIPDLSRNNVDTDDLRDYLDMLPLGSKITYDGKHATVSEVKSRDIDDVPEDLREYYVKSKKLRKPRTIN